MDLKFRASEFGATRLGGYETLRAPLSPVLTSFFVNYDVSHTTFAGRDFTTRRDLGALTELGFSSGLGVLTSSHVGRNIAEDENLEPRQWRRLETTFNRDFPDHNLTLRLGDSSTRTSMWGRQVYFGHATEHFAHVLQLEGTIASNYHDAQLTYVSMGADMVADTQVKTGGVDAAEPMGTGLVMNIITKSGGNAFRGSAALGYQPYEWNGNNVDNCSTAPGCRPGTGGTPTTAYVRQFDASFGGPIVRDQVWFFGALRRALSSSGISRTAAEVARIEAYQPGAALFDNDSESWQPFFKVTSRVGAHDIQGFYQRDRLLLDGNREYNYEKIMAQSTGGSLYGGKITSVWSDRMTSTFIGSYNNKGGNDIATFDALGLSGPQIIIHLVVTVPIVVWVMIGYFETTPMELEEAASIDGANSWQVFRLVALPIARPGIVVALILAVIFSWNNFVFGVVLANRETRTLPVAVYNMLSYEQVSWGPLAAAALVVTLPVLVLTMFAQRQIVAGLTAGAVKGG